MTNIEKHELLNTLHSLIYNGFSLPVYSSSPTIILKRKKSNSDGIAVYRNKFLEHCPGARITDGVYIILDEQTDYDLIQLKLSLS